MSWGRESSAKDLSQALGGRCYGEAGLHCLPEDNPAKGKEGQKGKSFFSLQNQTHVPPVGRRPPEKPQSQGKIGWAGSDCMDAAGFVVPADTVCVCIP